jgi:hypothetical protein
MDAMNITGCHTAIVGAQGLQTGHHAQPELELCSVTGDRSATYSIFGMHDEETSFNH